MPRVAPQLLTNAEMFFSPQPLPDRNTGQELRTPVAVASLVRTHQHRVREVVVGRALRLVGAAGETELRCFLFTPQPALQGPALPQENLAADHRVFMLLIQLLQKLIDFRMAGFLQAIGSRVVDGD